MHTVKKINKKKKVWRCLSFRTIQKSKCEETEEGGKRERQGEKSEGQIMSDGEEEAILWAV